MLNSYGMKDSMENRLAAYNWGIGNLKKFYAGEADMPDETANYITKYMKLLTGK